MFTPPRLTASCFGEQRRGAPCQRTALAEMYALAATSSFIYSEASTFSSIAFILGRSAGTITSAQSGCAASAQTALSKAEDRNETFLEGLHTRPLRDLEVWWLE